MPENRARTRNGVGIGLSQELGNLGVAEVEHVVEQEHPAFGRRETLQHDEKCHRNLIEHLDTSDSSIVECDRLGQSIRSALLAARPGRVELIEAQARDHLDDMRPGRVNLDRALLPADPRFLHGVLGATHLAQHAVSERQEI